MVADAGSWRNWEISSVFFCSLKVLFPIAKSASSFSQKRFADKVVRRCELYRSGKGGAFEKAKEKRREIKWCPPGERERLQTLYFASTGNFRMKDFSKYNHIPLGWGAIPLRRSKKNFCFASYLHVKCGWKWVVKKLVLPNLWSKKTEFLYIFSWWNMVAAS